MHYHNYIYITYIVVILVLNLKPAISVIFRLFLFAKKIRDKTVYSQTFLYNKRGKYQNCVQAYIEKGKTQCRGMYAFFLSFF
jgi:hypothetical protein